MLRKSSLINATKFESEKNTTGIIFGWHETRKRNCHLIVRTDHGKPLQKMWKKIKR